MRRHWPRALATAPVLAVLMLGTAGLVPVVRPAYAQVDARFCAAGQSPQFVHGIAALRDRLGSRMGDPAECEHVDPQSGDTVQRTTTGLAYYRSSINMAIFTDGEAHWGRAGDGGNQVVLWRNASVTPPQPTDAEAGYLTAVGPLRDRAAALQRRLIGAYQQAERGQLDSLDPAALRSLVNELQATRDAYARLRNAGRLGRHHGLMVQALNTGMGAAEMLTQARQLPGGPIRASFQTSAAKYAQESERLRQASSDAYVRALPVVVIE